MNKLLISSKDIGLRLDKFLLKHSSLSWNHIQKLLRTPRFYVHNIQIRKSYKFKENDLLEYPSNLSLNPISSTSSFPIGFQDMFKKTIIFEDSDLIAINKPTGLASQGGINIKLSADVLAEEYAGGKLMHRLDKSVSGLLLFGKTKEACNIPVTDKTYYAILFGNLQDSGIITNKIGRIGRIQKVSEEGKDSITKFQTIEKLTFDNQTYSLAKIQISTGRKHQIRVHFAQSLGCPVLGDTKYGGPPSGNRIYLHSYSCTIKSIQLKAEFPSDFLSKLQTLGFSKFLL